MKRSEIITENYEAIADEMTELYRTALECDGRIQYKLYIWEDGELESLQGPQGDTSYLQPRSAEPRRLFYVCTVTAFAGPWDYADHAAPEDEAERETERAEIVDWLMREYRANASDVLDIIIDEAEREERYEY